jgi:hypothetical protein
MGSIRQLPLLIEPIVHGPAKMEIARSNIAKYLSQYAERETHICDQVATAVAKAQWDAVVAVPLCAESQSIEALLYSLEGAAAHSRLRVLTILTINQRASAAEWIRASNCETWDSLTEAFSPLAHADGETRWFLGTKGFIGVLVVDRFTAAREFPEKQGVGLARKIGSDIALGLINRRVVTSPYIFNTDGDAVVAADYFDLGQHQISANASDTFITPFLHKPSDDGSSEEKLAIELYDRFLHLYVDGLTSAGSPYAFHTVGSTIGYHANAYAAVRGFPRREAGEDFYLLNKLAKVGPVRTRNVKPIVLAGRVSHRVPFGTGASVGKIAEQLKAGERYQVYHQSSYFLLKVWLEEAKKFLTSGDTPTLLANLEKRVDEVNVPRAGTQLIQHLRDSGALDYLAIARASSSDPVKVNRAFDHWFDAFRTLKLIHWIRDHILPPQDIDFFP